MLRFLDGCSSYTTAQIGRKWTGGTLVAGGASSVAISGATGRNGVSSLHFVAAASVGVTALVIQNLDSQASWVIGFAVKFSAFTNGGSTILCEWRDGTNTQCDLRVSSAGILSVTRNGTALTGGTAVAALLANTWYYLEWSVTISSSIAANSCQVYKDGVSIINVAAGQSTKAGTPSTASNVRLGINQVNTPTVSFTVDICDVYILDGQAGHTTVYGDTRVVTLMPTGTGTTHDWTPDSGTAANSYSRVNATVSADGASGYVQTGTIGLYDTYAMADLPGGTASVRSAQVVLTAIETDVGTRTVGAEVRSGGADHASAGQQLTSGYAMYRVEYENDPNGSIAWTPTTINAAEVGPVLVS